MILGGCQVEEKISFSLPLNLKLVVCAGKKTVRFLVQCNKTQNMSIKWMMTLGRRHKALRAVVSSHTGRPPANHPKQKLAAALT